MNAIRKLEASNSRALRAMLYVMPYLVIAAASATSRLDPVGTGFNSRLNVIPAAANATAHRGTVIYGPETANKTKKTSSEASGRPKTIFVLKPVEDNDTVRRQLDTVVTGHDNKTTYSSNINISSPLDASRPSPEVNAGDESIAYAVQKGFRAQLELCDSYCNGTARVSLSYCSGTAGVRCSDCYCDEACKHYGDCCPSLDSDQALDVGRANPNMCVEMMFGFDRRIFEVITVCPATALGDHVKSETTKCRDCGKSSVAAALSLDTRAIYCSESCGQCHGERNLVPLPPTTCLDTGENTFVFNYRDDSEFLLQPKRWCRQDEYFSKRRLVDSCDDMMTSEHVHGEAMEALCRQYHYPVHIRNVSYRNLFCALCNGVTVLVSQGFCRTGFQGRETKVLITILTSLSPVYTYDTVGPKQCLDHQWYDFVIDQCRNVSCEEGRIQVPGHPLYCVSDPATAVGPSTSLSYRLSAEFKVITNSTHVPCLQDWSSLGNVITSQVIKTIRKLNSTLFSVQGPRFESQRGVFSTGVSFVAPENKNQTEFELKMIDYFTDPRLSLKVLENNVIDFQTNLVSEWNWGLHSDSREDGVIFNKSTTVLFGPLTPYAIVHLNSSEFVIPSYLADTVTLTSTNATLARWKTQLKNQKLKVAAAFLQEAYEAAELEAVGGKRVMVPRPSNPVLEVLSLCCLVVSVLSLVFLLTTYSVFPKLRSLPGLNNMWLAGWLLTAQLLLLTVPGRTELGGACLALGVLLHYAWLCVITWSCVCSMHMFHVFVMQQRKMRAPHGNAWYLKRYVAVAHTIPAFIVALAAGITTLLTQGQDAGYGGHVCYLNSVLLRGLAFVLPLALSVVVNLVLLVLTVCSLAGAEHVQSYGQRSEPSYISIYARLSSLTGFCWVFALVAELPGCDWMHYVSAVLNGLQGLHLAVSYAGNKRVVGMWRAKVMCKGGKEEKRSFTTSGQTPGTLSSSV